MAGQFGVDNMCKLANDVAIVVATVVNVIRKESGPLSLLKLVPVVLDVRGVDFSALAAEAKELDAEDRAKVEAALASGLADLGDLQAKVALALSSVDDAFLLAAEIQEVVSDVLALVAKVRAILGV